jgi:carbon-monoxide dehydrogenase small subunit
VELSVYPNATLSTVLRDELELTDVKDACGKGDCGNCAVILDSEIVNSCLILAVQVDGSNIQTARGLKTWDKMKDLRRSFVKQAALQCGYCTPGILLALKILLDRDPIPTDSDIRTAISGNLCRCGSYNAVVRAVQDVVGPREVED